MVPGYVVVVFLIALIGLFVKLTSGEKSDPSNLVVYSNPGLVAVLLNREKKKGSPLTKEEVIQIRDACPSIVLRKEVADAMDEKRGYKDIDPENCWDEWQEIRRSFNREPGLIICVPGPWKDRSEFSHQVAMLEPKGQYMFSAGILTDLSENDHIPMEFRSADPHIPAAFEIAGQGKLPQSTLARIQEHKAVVYLHFPLDIRAQRDRVAKFTTLLQRLGGLAVKVESAGIAHTWEHWFALLNGSLLDLYSSAVVFVEGTDHYYTCGMHQFGLPECAVPASIPAGEAAGIMNEFNLWQIDKAPTLESGQTFSRSTEEPRFRLTLETDNEHKPGHQFFNARGVWFLHLD